MRKVRHLLGARLSFSYQTPPAMKQKLLSTTDIITLRADGDTADSGSNIGVALVNNSGDILNGTAAIISAANTKRSYSENKTSETKTINFNNGTTIAAIIGASVIIAVIVIVLLRRK